MPLQITYILKLCKIFSFGVELPHTSYQCVKMWGGVLRAKFHPVWCNLLWLPLLGQQPQNCPKLSKTGTCPACILMIIRFTE